jgi:hypothetical protein
VFVAREIANLNTTINLQLSRAAIEQFAISFASARTKQCPSAQRALRNLPMSSEA